MAMVSRPRSAAVHLQELSGEDDDEDGESLSTGKTKEEKGTLVLEPRHEARSARSELQLRELDADDDADCAEKDTDAAAGEEGEESKGSGDSSPVEDKPSSGPPPPRESDRSGGEVEQSQGGTPAQQPPPDYLARGNDPRSLPLPVGCFAAGWLTKRGHVRQNWKRRWFEVRGSVVTYSKGPGMAPLNTVDLVEGKTYPAEWVGRRHCIALQQRPQPFTYEEGYILFVDFDDAEHAYKWRLIFDIAVGVRVHVD
jgi:PH domain